MVEGKKRNGKVIEEGGEDRRKQKKIEEYEIWRI